MLTLRQLQKLAANDSMIVVDVLKSAVMSANAYLMLRIIFCKSLDDDCSDKCIPIKIIWNHPLTSILNSVVEDHFFVKVIR